MDIHRMKCFLCLAEELHFTRAARKQCMAQSTMSHQIHNMEEELGVQLFQRNNKTVVLTQAGEFLKGEFIRLLEEYDAVVSEAKRIDLQAVNSLTIGYHGPFNWMVSHPLFGNFKAGYPEIELSLSLENWGDIPSKLQSGEIGVGFIEGAELEEQRNLDSRFLYRDYICFAVPGTHPLASKKVLRAEDIKDEPMVMVDLSIGRKSINAIHQRLIKGGINILKGKLLNKFENCMAMVSAGTAISPMPQSFKQNFWSDIVYIDYENTEAYVDIYMAWIRGNNSPALQKFVQFASETAPRG